ncbi:transducin beta-like protein 3 isoform X2 [Anarrhichthys ocellatus]|uniref:transducin beta-like protein 3 isoform X2 n=1 Tax=Anarrhichthys ocellatus TaxID=433405 RepID=UPI0012EE1EEE|nr:transducin beta-like protein 3 isoform X2 [Anarrhichthys ocellatus]
MKTLQQLQIYYRYIRGPRTARPSCGHWRRRGSWACWGFLGATGAASGLSASLPSTRCWPRPPQTVPQMWSLQDFSCLKTFEGHDASVLKVIFVSRGIQLLTSGSDGLVKLWTIKTNECVKTLDAHQDKVWGLHSSHEDDKMGTGSADSNITVWVVKDPSDAISAT